MTAVPSTSEPAAAAPPSREELFALMSAVMLPMFLAAVDQTLLAGATPRIGVEFGSLGDTSWIVVGYLLATTVTAPVYGRLGDRLGRGRMLLAALGVFMLGSVACAMAQSMPMLIGGRVLQGLGGGGLMVLSQALIGQLVAPIHRPRYEAYFAVVFAASSIGGPVIGGLVVQHASWRWLFVAQLPLVAFAAWRVAKLPPAPPSRLRGTPLDPWGVLLFAGAACSALLWLSLAGHRFAWLSPVSFALLAGAVGIGTLLLWQQRRHPSPFLPLDLLREPGVAPICGVVMCFAAALFALIFLLPFYLQLAGGASAAGAAMQLLPMTAGIVAGSLITGRVTTRTGLPTQAPPVGLSISAVAVAALALAPPSTWSTNAVLALAGIGFGSVMPTAQLTIQILAGREKLGAAAGLLSISRSTGAALGTAFFGGLAFAMLGVQQRGAGTAQALEGLSAQAAGHAFRVAFGAVAILVALGVWIASRLPRIDLRQQGETR